MNFMGYFSFIDFMMYGPFQLHLQGYFQIVSVNIYNVHVRYINLLIYTVIILR